MLRGLRRSGAAEELHSSGYNFVLLTYDSCRYDVLLSAHTPVLDSCADVILAETPGNYTFAAHMSFFSGILPCSIEPLPYYNRFVKQLIGLVEVGEGQVAKSALHTMRSDDNVLAGFKDSGYQVVGAGAMNWFRQHSLTRSFEKFSFTGTDAKSQVDFVRSAINLSKPFFAFINFGETHAPFSYAGQSEACPVDVRARLMEWPPVESGPVGRQSPAFGHQVQAAEFLDRQLGRFLDGLPGNTIVVLCSDHGESFGEDGYWGHGHNHRTVLEVPMSIFTVSGEPLP
jgi:Sulfatase